MKVTDYFDKFAGDNIYQAATDNLTQASLKHMAPITDVHSSFHSLNLIIDTWQLNYLG